MDLKQKNLNRRNVRGQDHKELYEQAKASWQQDTFQVYTSLVVKKTNETSSKQICIDLVVWANMNVTSTSKNGHKNIIYHMFI